MLKNRGLIRLLVATVLSCTTYWGDETRAAYAAEDITTEIAVPHDDREISGPSEVGRDQGNVRGEYGDRNLSDLSVDEIMHMNPADLRRGPAKVRHHVPNAEDRRQAHIAALLPNGPAPIAAPDNSPDFSYEKNAEAAGQIAKAQRDQVGFLGLASAAIDEFRGKEGAMLLYLFLGAIAAVAGHWFAIARNGDGMTRFQQMKLGKSLADITTIFEQIERTRYSMPIGAGGGWDSLRPHQRAAAAKVLATGEARFRACGPAIVTREIAKNMQLSAATGRDERLAAQLKMVDYLFGQGLAVEYSN